ncbi:hypothetical protein EYF80_020923 [Liparis tanakae]|uniref:Uncharacterized protein n=1 Tax=Liparis tanakae TaxID=230148 RepID=A0A4Z2HT06_9TELE|nr:hypothetical protein EYF80_020923 [Liparis tanakae]
MSRWQLLPPTRAPNRGSSVPEGQRYVNPLGPTYTCYLPRPTPSAKPRKMAGIFSKMTKWDRIVYHVQGQQTAESRGADGSGDTTRAPHQVRKQDDTQELLRLIVEKPGRRQRVQTVTKKRARRRKEEGGSCQRLTRTLTNRNTYNPKHLLAASRVRVIYTQHRWRRFVFLMDSSSCYARWDPSSEPGLEAATAEGSEETTRGESGSGAAERGNPQTGASLWGPDIPPIGSPSSVNLSKVLRNHGGETLCSLGILGSDQLN